MSSGRTPAVAIIGAGLAGISTAIALKTQLKFENFIIYEKADIIGGTWRHRTTRIRAVDQMFPVTGQSEIQAYWMHLWHKHNLESHTKLGHLVRRAEWDASNLRYHLRVENVATGETTEADAEILFSAIGGFVHPTFPKDIPDVDTFRGKVWHSARWNHEVDLKNKRVGVIGNGCSAAQFIPEISKEASTTVINFVRTPQWYLPRDNMRYPAWLQWVFANIPWVMRLHRIYIMAESDLHYLIFNKKNMTLLWLTRRSFTDYIRKMAPREYLDKLIPPFSVGCKRIIIDPDYLKSLHRPNVSLRWEGIECITKEGIKLKTGEIVPLDVIIFGTGFSLLSNELTIRGSKGLTLLEYSQQQGGAAAYLGTCMPGFPNMFQLLGPNTATGHGSVIFTEEVQINYAMQMVKAVIEGRVKSFEVKAQVCEEYDAWVQRRLKNQVWTECHSYYYIGQTPETKNVAMFPGPVGLLWWMMRRPVWGNYDVVVGEAPDRAGRGWIWLIAAAAVAVVGTAAGRYALDL